MDCKEICNFLETIRPKNFMWANVIFFSLHNYMQRLQFEVVKVWTTALITKIKDRNLSNFSFWKKCHLIIPWVWQLWDLVKWFTRLARVQILARATFEDLYFWSPWSYSNVLCIFGNLQSFSVWTREVKNLAAWLDYKKAV